MASRIVEIVNEGRHLAVERGFLVVMERQAEIGRLPLDDIAALIANAHGLTYSNNLLIALTKRGIPTVLCGPNHMPEAIIWPVDAHHAQTKRMKDQVEAGLPQKKRLWAEIVRAKIAAQGAALAATGAPHGAFDLLSRKVRSGDPGNVEAEAARRYWPLLLGEGFRRDREGGGVNALLNYGYAILRATVARAVMASGLHPSLGLNHSNRSNPMVLVDDLMEPFRPVVDLQVWRMAQGRVTTLDRDEKAALARIAVIELATRDGVSPLMTCAERLAQSLARAFAGESRNLDLPLPTLPLTP